jgi:DNA helicase-2/ATP-dependent DNA helicase PcrA
MDAGLLAPAELLGLNHLIVDEFQDLNPMDLRFVYGLARAGTTLFVAGDDDQSLYSFRYARPEGIQLMPEELGPVGDHLLQHCFRSTTSVLEAASTLIKSFATPERIEKHYVSLYADSDPPVEGGFGCWRFREGIDEANAIAVSARRLIAAGLRPREIMILLSNARGVTWQFRNALQEEGVPFELPRGTRFKDTDTGRALATVLRIALREDDYVALRTLLTIQPGVGVATAGSIANIAIASSLQYGALFREALPADTFAPRLHAALENSQAVCAELVDWGASDALLERVQDIDRVLNLVLGREPDIAWREEVGDIPDEATLEELAEYLAAEKVDEQAEVLAAIYGRLGRAIEPEETLPDRVRVMTMHSAKGLAATVVFIPTLEEEMLPGERRARVPGLVLEAARMLYVSITRARVGCIVSYAENRFINGVRTRHAPSRFLGHLGCRFTAGGALTQELADQVVEASRNL